MPIRNPGPDLPRLQIPASPNIASSSPARSPSPATTPPSTPDYEETRQRYGILREVQKGVAEGRRLSPETEQSYREVLDVFRPTAPAGEFTMDPALRASSKLFKHNVNVARQKPDALPPGYEYGQTHRLSPGGTHVDANQDLIRGTHSRGVRINNNDANFPPGTFAVWHSHPNGHYPSLTDQDHAHKRTSHPVRGNPDLEHGILHLPTGDKLLHSGVPGTGFWIGQDPHPAPAPSPADSYRSRWTISPPDSPATSEGPGSAPHSSANGG